MNDVITVTEPPEVPQLDALILAVGGQVPPVPLAGDVDQAVSVSTELAHRMRVRLAQRPSVPDLQRIGVKLW